MGRRERDQWDLPPLGGAALALLCALFLLGGGAGCIFAGVAGGEGAEQLAGYLSDYLALAREDPVPRALWPLIWEQMKYLLGTVLLGMTALGVVGIPALFLARGFFFSFSVGCFCRVFGWAGLIPALALFGLPALLWAPAFFLAGVQGLCGARCLLRRILGDGRSPLPFAPGYWLRVCLCLCVGLACGGVEYLAVPVLLRAAARAVM